VWGEEPTKRDEPICPDIEMLQVRFMELLILPKLGMPLALKYDI
jgi:hypothetical protein